MKSMFCRFLVVALFLAFFAPVAARADEEYASPTYQNLVKMLVRFGALNVGDDDVLDEYAMIEECDIYKKYYGNDFEWNKIRTALRQSLRQTVATFPTTIHYAIVSQFGHYDFKAHVYDFTDEASLKGVSSFVLEAKSNARCGSQGTKLIPVVFRVVLDQPVGISGLTLNEADAKALLQAMEQDKNAKHLVYVRFNMKIGGIAPLERKKDGQKLLFDRMTQPSGNGGIVQVEAGLDSIDFYEDEAATKLVYTYRR